MNLGGVYRGGGQKKRVNPREIRKMIENMKKVPVIKEKAEKYHKKEQEEAELLLQKIQDNKK